MRVKRPLVRTCHHAILLERERERITSDCLCVKRPLVRASYHHAILLLLCVFISSRHNCYVSWYHDAILLLLCVCYCYVVATAMYYIACVCYCYVVATAMCIYKDTRKACLEDRKIAVATAMCIYKHIRGEESGSGNSLSLSLSLSY